MVVIRYVALAALALLIGATGFALLVAHPTLRDLRVEFSSGHGGLFVELLHLYHRVAALCGVAIFACLTIVKLVGPPPRTFKVRATLVVLMLVVVLFSWVPIPQHLVQVPAQTTLMGVNLLLGLVLLCWYARE